MGYEGEGDGGESEDGREAERREWVSEVVGKRKTKTKEGTGAAGWAGPDQAMGRLHPASVK